MSDETMPDDFGVTYSTGVIRPILWERRGSVVHLVVMSEETVRSTVAPDHPFLLPSDED